MIARALNQKTARHLPFVEFLQLAQSVGCIGVEPRNDLGRPLFDGIPAAQAGQLARDHGLRLVGLSEVYPFNDWSDERAGQVQALIDQAEASGAETISLIPRVDGVSCEDGARQAILRAVLREILPMLQGRRVRALIEPIGFETSSLRHLAEAAEAIEAVGGDGRFGLVHDTFQHCIAGGGPICPAHTAIVHISGIPNARVPLDSRLDAHRVFVDDADRCGTVAQIQNLLAAGYDGAFSFECTSAALTALPDLKGAIADSFAHIDAMTR